MHDPTRQAELGSIRKAGGKARSTVSRAGKHLPDHLRTMQERLITLVDDVGEKKLTPQQAQAIVATVGKLLDLARFSLEVGETEALARRVAELEEKLAELGA
jgi:hypothetical protein